jgi:chromosome segregation ATPase
MKKIAVLTMTCSLLVVAFCLSAYAEDVASQISVLEQRADRVQTLISQAKQQNEAGIDAQVKALGASIESLIKQRVQLDAHIARLEGQVSEFKQNADATLSRQVKQYEQDLAQIKAQITSLMTQKNTPEAAPKAEPPKPPAQMPAVPAPPAQ